MQAKRATFVIIKVQSASQIRFFCERSEPRLSQTKIRKFLELDSFASEASHVCQRNQNQRYFKLDSFASEASHVCHRNSMLESKPKCERSELPASEASHPRERSDREPPAGLASRPGAAGAEGRIASCQKIASRYTYSYPF